MTDEEVATAHRTAVAAGVAPELLEYVQALVRSWAPERQESGQAIVTADVVKGPRGSLDIQCEGDLPIRLANSYDSGSARFHSRSVLRTLVELDDNVRALEHKVKETSGAIGLVEQKLGAPGRPPASAPQPSWATPSFPFEQAARYVSVELAQQRRHDEEPEALGPGENHWQQTNWPREDGQGRIQYPSAKWDRHEEARYRILMAKALNRTTQTLLRCVAVLEAAGHEVFANRGGRQLESGPATWQTAP